VLRATITGAQAWAQLLRQLGSGGTVVPGLGRVTSFAQTVGQYWTAGPVAYRTGAGGLREVMPEPTGNLDSVVGGEVLRPAVPQPHLTWGSSRLSWPKTGAAGVRLRVPVRCGQRSEQIADAMTAVTAFGWEISVRCDPPWNMVMCECARRAIARWDAAVMI
jgi:hypothetical protein